MGASDQVIVMYLLTSVFLKVQSQSFQNLHIQYENQPYAQYPQVYGPSYLPYPYNQPQTYQQQFNYYTSSHPYPAQSFPVNTQYTAAYPAQNYYPYSHPGVNSGINSAISSIQRYPMSSYGDNEVLSDQNNDPGSNIITKIINIEPKYFDQYKKYLNLKNNFVIDQTNPRHLSSVNRQLYQPTYTIKTEIKQTNSTSIPQVIDKHNIQAILKNPEKEEKDIVINLYFLNGVEATTSNTTILDEEPISYETENLTTSTEPNDFLEFFR